MPAAATFLNRTQMDPNGPKLTPLWAQIDPTLGPKWFGRTIGELRRWGLPKAWAGQTCYLVGGGPALRGFDFGQLRGLHTIAINRAFLDCPEAEVVCFSDGRFWRWWGPDGTEGQSLPGHPGLKITVQSDRKVSHPTVLNMTGTGRRGLETRRNRLRHGNSTGCASMNVAWHLGAARIVLLGYDGKPAPDGGDNYHGGHPVGYAKANPRLTAYDKMAPYYEPIGLELAARRVEVINASPDSAITCFPRVTLSSIFPI